MDKYVSVITFSEARYLAECSALSDIGCFRDSADIPLLDVKSYEGECCWFFFRNMEIIVPENMSLRAHAYAVSKRGSVRGIAEFSGDIIQIKEYLKKMSDHFKQNGE